MCFPFVLLKCKWCARARLPAKLSNSLIDFHLIYLVIAISSAWLKKSVQFWEMRVEPNEAEKTNQPTAKWLQAIQSHWCKFGIKYNHFSSSPCSFLTDIFFSISAPTVCLQVCVSSLSYRPTFRSRFQLPIYENRHSTDTKLAKLWPILITSLSPVFQPILGLISKRYFITLWNPRLPIFNHFNWINLMGLVNLSLSQCAPPMYWVASCFRKCHASSIHWSSYQLKVFTFCIPNHNHWLWLYIGAFQRSPRMDANTNSCTNVPVFESNNIHSYQTVFILQIYL